MSAPALRGRSAPSTQDRFAASSAASGARGTTSQGDTAGDLSYWYCEEYLLHQDSSAVSETLSTTQFGRLVQTDQPLGVRLDDPGNASSCEMTRPDVSGAVRCRDVWGSGRASVLRAREKAAWCVCSSRLFFAWGDGSRPRNHTSAAGDSSVVTPSSSTLAFFGRPTPVSRAISAAMTATTLLESNTEAPILVLPPRGCHLPARGVAPSSIRSARRQRCWPWLVRP